MIRLQPAQGVTRLPQLDRAQDRCHKLGRMGWSELRREADPIKIIQTRLEQLAVLGQAHLPALCRKALRPPLVVEDVEVDERRHRPSHAPQGMQLVRLNQNHVAAADLDLLTGDLGDALPFLHGEQEIVEQPAWRSEPVRPNHYVGQPDVRDHWRRKEASLDHGKRIPNLIDRSGCSSISR